MEIRPVDLPHLRDEVIHWLSGDDAAGIWRSALKIGRPEHLYAARENYIDEVGAYLRQFEASQLQVADLYYVSKEMVELAVVAARTVPHYQLESEDVPTLSGLMAFETTPWAGVFAGVSADVRAIRWGCQHPHPDAPPGVMTVVYYDRDDVAPVIAARTQFRDPVREPALIYGHQAEGFWPFGENADLANGGEDWTNNAIIRALWLLMTQTLTVEVEAKFDRAALRRFKRECVDPPRVRVITLRRAQHGAAGESDREYHHQWIVRGHWRQQWYPARQVHRPVWIAPHIKGPEGAPLLGGEKVYALRR